MSDKVNSKDTVYLKNKDRVVVAGNIHYHSGKMKWYLYPRLGNVANYGVQPLIIRLVANVDRPIQHMDRACIETKEFSHYGDVLGAFSYGVYYFTKQDDRQEWELIRTNGKGELNYGDEFRLRNCYYKSSYLQEYHSDKWSMYYLTTTEEAENATDWQFNPCSIIHK